MDGLNYHHLLYFWTVARAGSIAKASAELKLTQPTISEQIRLLEKSLGKPLFLRSGRTLILTATGKTVFNYAERIFSIGRELTDCLRGSAQAEAPHLRIAVERHLGRAVVLRLLDPALRRREKFIVHLETHSFDPAFALMSDGKLDVVLAEEQPRRSAKGYAHPLLDCGTAFLASRPRAHAQFPKVLDGQPFLWPAPPLRRKLEDWFRASKISPRTAGEFECAEHMIGFAQQGFGIIALPAINPSVIPGLKVIGRTDTVRSRFCAYTCERRPANPAVVALVDGESRK